MTGFMSGRPGFETGNAPGSIQALLDGEEIADLLFELLANVVDRQHPEVAAILRGKTEPGEFAPEVLSRVFQVHGIWFQLLAIVEQHTAMRLRRQTERVRQVKEPAQKRCADYLSRHASGRSSPLTQPKRSG
jgi:hypothetical protein